MSEAGSRGQTPPDVWPVFGNVCSRARYGRRPPAPRLAAEFRESPVSGARIAVLGHGDLCRLMARAREASRESGSLCGDRRLSEPFMVSCGNRVGFLCGCQTSVRSVLVALLLQHLFSLRSILPVNLLLIPFIFCRSPRRAISVFDRSPFVPVSLCRRLSDSSLIRWRLVPPRPRVDQTWHGDN